MTAGESALTPTELLTAFSTLEKETEKLLTLLRACSFRVVDPFNLKGEGHEQLPAMMQAIANFYYTQEGDGRRTAKLPGAIGTSPEAIAQAEVVNAAKLDFATLCRAYKKSTHKNVSIGGLLADAEADSPIRRPFHAGILNQVSVKQATRKLHILPCTPRLVSWSWDRARRSIERMPAHKALSLIEKKGFTSTAAEIDKQNLASLNDSEIAIVQKHSLPSLFITAFLTNEEGVNSEWKRSASLPMLYLHTEGISVKFQFHNPDPDNRKGKTRRDRVISDSADFATIRGHLIG